MWEIFDTQPCPTVTVRCFKPVNCTFCVFKLILHLKFMNFSRYAYPFLDGFETESFPKIPPQLPKR